MHLVEAMFIDDDITEKLKTNFDHPFQIDVIVTQLLIILIGYICHHWARDTGFYESSVMLNKYNKTLRALLVMAAVYLLSVSFYAIYDTVHNMLRV